MGKIILSALLHLPGLLKEYVLTDYNLVDLSVGSDEQVYLLFTRKDLATDDTHWCAIVLLIDWQTGSQLLSG